MSKKYTLDELAQQPIIVEVSLAGSPELLSTRCESIERKKFDSMSAMAAVHYVLKNYHRDQDSDYLARLIKSSVENLGDNLMLKIYDQLLTHSSINGTSHDERDNPINNSLYLREAADNGEKCLKSSIILGEESDFDQGYCK